MRVIRIPTWREYQHYSDRNPPWIKLHRSLLTSHRWVSLDSAGRELMVALMVLAADNDNMTPADPDYIRRRAFLAATPDLQRLVDIEFIEIVTEAVARKRNASDALAGRKQVASVSGEVASSPPQNATPETETETETETEKRGGGAAAPPAWSGKVIRLKQADYDQWRKSYDRIDINAELQAADDYYSRPEHRPKGGKWFFPVSRWLKKANDEARARAGGSKPGGWDGTIN